MDAWGLGCLMQEAFGGRELARTEDLRNTVSIPKPALQVTAGQQTSLALCLVDAMSVALVYDAQQATLSLYKATSWHAHAWSVQYQ